MRHDDKASCVSCQTCVSVPYNTVKHFISDNILLPLKKPIFLYYIVFCRGIMASVFSLLYLHTVCVTKRTGTRDNSCRSISCKRPPLRKHSTAVINAYIIFFLNERYTTNITCCKAVNISSSWNCALIHKPLWLETVRTASLGNENAKYWNHLKT